MKIIQIIIGIVLAIPVAFAQSVFSNPAFDTILLILLAIIFFIGIKKLIEMLK